jgi:ephrin-B
MWNINLIVLYCFSILLIAGTFSSTFVEAKKMHYIHWNRANPMFRLDNTDHIVDVNNGNLPWEYDQVNIICPVSKPGVQYPEKHVIYSVSREEFDSCRITNPKPKIVAICDQPHRLMYFTITFRSFTPTPGGLEFRPGQDYYFISTASRKDLHRRVGGGCSSHNMKMIFKVANNRDNANTLPPVNKPRIISEEPDNSVDIDNEIETITSLNDESSTTEQVPLFRRYNNNRISSMRGGEYIYYYHPRDLIELENNSIYQKKRNSRISRYDNEVLKKQALKFTSGSNTIVSLNIYLVTFLVAALAMLR